MSGDNISLGEVMTDDKFNLATIYNSQRSGDDQELDYPPFSHSESESCNYYEPQNLLNFVKKKVYHGNKHTQSYIHLNCRGLSSNWEKFQDLLCDMHSDEFSFDYIGISEVFRCDLDQRISLPGYHKFITRCREINDDNRGGVGLFVRESMDYKIRDDLSVFIPHVYESLFIELLPKNGKHTIIGVIYRPNTFPRANIDVFTTTLLGVMDEINGENKKAVVLGDMNINMLNNCSHDQTDMWIVFLQEGSFHVF